MCPSASHLYAEHLLQSAEGCRCQQFTALPERKVLTPAHAVKAVICVILALSPEVEITN